MTDIKELFGRKVKEYRKKRNLTQSQLGEMVGIEGKQISCIETGKNFPSPETISALSNALDVEPKELFEFYYLQDLPDLKIDIISMLNKLDEKELALAHKYIRTFLLK